MAIGYNNNELQRKRNTTTTTMITIAMTTDYNSNHNNAQYSKQWYKMVDDEIQLQWLWQSLQKKSGTFYCSPCSPL